MISQPPMSHSFSPTTVAVWWARGANGVPVEVFGQTTSHVPPWVSTRSVSLKNTSFLHPTAPHPSHAFTPSPHPLITCRNRGAARTCPQSCHRIRRLHPPAGCVQGGKNQGFDNRGSRLPVLVAAAADDEEGAAAGRHALPTTCCQPSPVRLRPTPSDFRQRSALRACVFPLRHHGGPTAFRQPQGSSQLLRGTGWRECEKFDAH